MIHSISDTMKRITIVGERFGKLVCVDEVEIIDSRGTPRVHRICVCDCGSIPKSYKLANLRRGATKSCGCLRKETSKTYCTKPLHHVVCKQICNYYKRNALSRGLVWDITFEHVLQLIQQPCHYCGAVGVTVTNTRHTSKSDLKRSMRNNGIDRINNQIGYIFKNVVPCCKHCNNAKSTMTKTEFLSWVFKVHKHNNL